MQVLHLGAQEVSQITWIFNDPSSTLDTLIGVNASYTFTVAGDYNVCLIVETDLNCASNQDTLCQLVHIRALPSVNVVVDSVWQDPLLPTPSYLLWQRLHLLLTHGTLVYLLLIY